MYICKEVSVQGPCKHMLGRGSNSIRSDSNFGLRDAREENVMGLKGVGHSRAGSPPVLMFFFIWLSLICARINFSTTLITNYSVK